MDGRTDRWTDILRQQILSKGPPILHCIASSV